MTEIDRLNIEYAEFVANCEHFHLIDIAGTLFPAKPGHKQSLSVLATDEEHQMQNYFQRIVRGDDNLKLNRLHHFADPDSIQNNHDRARYSPFIQVCRPILKPKDKIARSAVAPQSLRVWDSFSPHPQARQYLQDLSATKTLAMFATGDHYTNQIAVLYLLQQAELLAPLSSLAGFMRSDTQSKLLSKSYPLSILVAQAEAQGRSYIGVTFSDNCPHIMSFVLKHLPQVRGLMPETVETLHHQLMEQTTNPLLRSLNERVLEHLVSCSNDGRLKFETTFPPNNIQVKLPSTISYSKGIGY